jgi:hypothetical protein
VKDVDFAMKQSQSSIPGLPGMRVRGLLQQQNLPAAIETASKAKERAGDKADAPYDAACLYALCADAAKNTKTPLCVGRGSEMLADEAMKLLQQAVAKGYKNASHMKQDKDLDPLRQREDLKKLLAEL